MLELRALRWRQPNWRKRYYELHADDGRIMATLDQPSAWKRHAVVVIEGRRLAIRAVGFWQNRIVARDEATGVDVAEYKVGRKGKLTFKTGRVFHWKRKSIWKPIHAFIAADNDEVVTFAREAKWFTMNAAVNISPNGAKYPELPVLLAFGWYLMILSAANSGGS
jgi:hypothetical protein